MNAMECSSETDNSKPTLYSCGLCEHVWFTKRMYRRHKSLYHRGLPMVESTFDNFDNNNLYNHTEWNLNFETPCGHKPVIYTCVICRVNYLNVSKYNDHNTKIHKELMNGNMKFLRQEHRTHFSVSSREKRK